MSFDKPEDFFSYLALSFSELRCFLIVKKFSDIFRSFSNVGPGHFAQTEDTCEHFCAEIFCRIRLGIKKEHFNVEGICAQHFFYLAAAERVTLVAVSR